MLLYADGSRCCRSDVLRATKLVQRQWQRASTAAAAGAAAKAAGLPAVDLHSAAPSCCNAVDRPLASGWPAKEGLVLSGEREAVRQPRDILNDDRS